MIDLRRLHDYLVLSRGRVMEVIRPLGPDAWDRAFEIGPGSIGRTLTHVLVSEWYYVQRLLERPVPPWAQWPLRDDEPLPMAELEPRWSEQSETTRAVLAGIDDWAAPLTYELIDDDGRHVAVTTTRGDLMVQLALHEVHHRAQVLNMLARLGTTLEDIDYNALMYDRRVLGGDDS